MESLQIDCQMTLTGMSGYGTIVGVRSIVGNEKIHEAFMPPLLQRIVKSGAIAGGTLAVAGFGVSCLARRALSSQGLEATDDNQSILAGLFFGAIGFALAAVLELISSAWRSIFKKDPPDKTMENAA